MREILFRAKTEPNCKSSMTGKIIKKPKWIYGYIDLGYMHDCETALISDEKGNNVYKCQYDTIGQYTGLTDKNGKKIFEGDIVKSPSYTSKGVVKFGLHEIACCGCCYDSHQTVGYFVDFGCRIESDESFWENLEIIGTIHDNPELLESEVQGE